MRINSWEEGGKDCLAREVRCLGFWNEYREKDCFAINRRRGRIQCGE